MQPDAQSSSWIATCRPMFSRIWVLTSVTLRPFRWEAAITLSTPSTMILKSTANRTFSRFSQLQSQYTNNDSFTSRLSTTSLWCLRCRWNLMLHNQALRMRALPSQVASLAVLIKEEPMQRPGLRPWALGAIRANLASQKLASAWADAHL